MFYFGLVWSVQLLFFNIFLQSSKNISFKKNVLSIIYGVHVCKYFDGYLFSVPKRLKQTKQIPLFISQIGDFSVLWVALELLNYVVTDSPEITSSGFSDTCPHSFVP